MSIYNEVDNVLTIKFYNLFVKYITSLLFDNDFYKPIEDEKMLYLLTNIIHKYMKIDGYTAGAVFRTVQDIIKTCSYLDPTNNKIYMWVTPKLTIDEIYLIFLKTFISFDNTKTNKTKIIFKYNIQEIESEYNNIFNDTDIAYVHRVYVDEFVVYNNDNIIKSYKLPTTICTQFVNNQHVYPSDYEQMNELVDIRFKYDI